MNALLAQIFLVGFGLNAVWEFSHCWLYETCRRNSWQENIPLLLSMALKDGLFIVLFYVIVMMPLTQTEILTSPVRLGLFILLSVSFAFVDERISVRRKRWEYAAAMPTILGAGLTPLLEIAVTGVLTFMIIFGA